MADIHLDRVDGEQHGYGQEGYRKQAEQPAGPVDERAFDDRPEESNTVGNHSQFRRSDTLVIRHGGFNNGELFIEQRLGAHRRREVHPIGKWEDPWQAGAADDPHPAGSVRHRSVAQCAEKQSIEGVPDQPCQRHLAL